MEHGKMGEKRDKCNIGAKESHQFAGTGTMRCPDIKIDSADTGVHRTEARE